MSEIEVIRRFIDAINAHDERTLVAMMSDDHILTDSLARDVRGKETVGPAWSHYFGWMSDYRIEVEHLMVDRGVVAVFGKASGTFVPARGQLRDTRWRIPAAWRAVVRDGRVAAWQVYADNKPVYEIIACSEPRGESV